MVTEQPLTCPSITEAQRGGGEKGLEVLWSTRATQDHLLLSTSKDKAQKSRCVPQGEDSHWGCHMEQGAGPWAAHLDPQGI